MQWPRPLATRTSMKKADIFEFYSRLAADNPDPETELNFGNTYQLVVAVALSAQSTDIGVNKATRALFAKVKTPQQMVELGVDGLKEHIKTIGLYNTKAKNVIAACRDADCRTWRRGSSGSRRAGEAARCRVAKTANVVLNCAFGAKRHSRSTPTSSGLGIARVWLREKPYSLWRRKLEKADALPLSCRRASLADPARPLYLQGADARMLALSGCRSLPVQKENTCRSG